MCYMHMKINTKRIMFIMLYIYVVNLLQSQSKRILTIPFENSTYSGRTILNITEEWKLQYEMLIDFERRRFYLVQNSEGSDEIYSDLFVIRTNNTTGLKNKCGFTFLRKVFEDEDYYLFRRSKTLLKRCRRDAEKFPHLRFDWTSRQVLKHRVKRNLVFNENLLENKINQKHSLFSEDERYFSDVSGSFHSRNIDFNDPLFPEQWYLLNLGQTGSPAENDINVLPVWQSGITGRGVSISVLDDGIYKNSPEVADNYDFVSSEEFLYQNMKHDPIPENSHGTYCAAIAAGVANNRICGVGVAYEAKVGGVRILDGPLTDVQEALALVHALDHVDIYTASWGPNDDGNRVDGPGILTRLAFIKGITMGRNGKGAIYVWAAGNGGGYYDNCNLDGYASSPFTLTIGALTEQGRSTYYSEPCASVIASTYVGGIAHIPSPEEIKFSAKKKIKVVVPEGKGKCKETFQGTSAAAPMAAGVIALALQANPNLTWRDIQHITIRTSRVPETDEGGWLINGAGFTFHPKIGSGVLDSDAMVTLALKWKSVAMLNVWTMSVLEERKLLLSNQETFFPFMVLKSSMHRLRRINHLETVIATINLYHPHCGDLEMILESPTGTKSPILTKRPNDNITTRFSYWDFLTLHFWGEDPEGLWILRVLNASQNFTGYMDYILIRLHGTDYLNDR